MAAQSKSSATITDVDRRTALEVLGVSDIVADEWMPGVDRLAAAAKQQEQSDDTDASR